MATLIARNDALVVSQVSTITPTPANSTNYKVSMNAKVVADYTSDGSGIAQEIVEGLQADLDASTVPEALEAEFTEDNSIVTATGVTGKPFTLVSAGAGTLTISNTVTVAESPNHWIAKNFGDATALPATGDTVIIDALTSQQSFKYELDQNTVVLAALYIKASSQAEIGLPEFNNDGASTYYQGGGYRETHLNISATALFIGEGIGPGSKRIKLNLGTNVCSATIYATSANRPSQSEAPVHLIGSHASNALHVISGLVDVGMLPGTGASCQWPSVVVDNGVTRFGSGCTLGVIEAAGNSVVETRSAVTTMRTRDNGRIVHYAGAIGTLDVNGSKVEIRATAILTVTQLNGYGGKELDLTNCDSVVTVTDMTIYGTPGNPFTIKDPNNKLVMTNNASTPNGAQSLVVVTGSGKTVKVV